MRSLQSGRTLLSGSGPSPVTMRTSAVPFRSAVARRVCDRSTVASSIRGCRFLNSVSVARRLPADIEVQKPIERRPASPRPFEFAVATSTSTCSRINLAIQRTLRPAGVGFTPPPERSNTVTPIRCSSRRIDRLRIECRMDSNSAACRILP